MPKIIWKGIIKSEEDFPTADIPKNAQRLNVEEDMRKMQVKALPFVIPSVLILFLCIILKNVFAGEKTVDFLFIFIGVIVGILLVFVHELLHAIAFPKHATVYIGIMPKSLAAVSLSSSPVKRNRFIFLSLLPVILGIIPLIVFCCVNKVWKVLNGLMFGMAIIGMVRVYPDFYNVFHVLKQVPKNAVIQNDKNTTYYYEQNIFETKCDADA